MMKPKIEKGKAFKENPLVKAENVFSNQPTPQTAGVSKTPSFAESKVLTAEEIYQKVKQYEEWSYNKISDFKYKKFILLSQVESALKEISDSLCDLSCHEAPNVCQCCKDNTKEFERIVKTFKEKLNMEVKNV